MAGLFTPSWARPKKGASIKRSNHFLITPIYEMRIHELPPLFYGPENNKAPGVRGFTIDQSSSYLVPKI